MKRIFVIIAGILSAVYMLNPTWGVFEFIPDNIPLVGNIDEATAMLVLLWSLRYFGIDPTTWFGNKEEGNKVME